MQQFLKKYFFLFGSVWALLFNCEQVKAGTPAVHISPKPNWLSVCKPYNQRPSARSIEKGFFYALIEQQVQIEKQADYHHVIKEIVSETGIQNASQISVGFDPSFERLDFHDITIWRNGKAINRLGTSKFKVIADEQELSNFIYQGSYSALCILDDIRKGDRIEYSYTITGRNPIFNGKYCDGFYFQWYYPIAHQYIVLITSTQRKLNIKDFNKIPSVNISEKSGLKTYAYESFQVPPARDNDDEPNWYNTKPHIQVSEYNDWAGIVNWALGINPVATNIKGELAERIADLKQQAGNDKEKYFREAVKTVQDEVRYMGIEIGQYSHRANNPEKVFRQRYGDCKDKSLLLVSMLRANGIDANMVLVNSSIKEHIADYIPTYNAFDHAVVVASLNGKQVWVDATIDYQGGKGTDIYFPGYGRGLILKEGNTGLITIPPSKTGKVFYEDTYNIKDEKSPVLFTVKTTYTLNEADDIRSRLASSGMAETEKNYLEYYGKIYPKIEPKDSITVNDDPDKNILTTTETYTINNYFKKDSATNKYMVDLYANYISQQLPSINGFNKTPVAVDYPLNIDYTIKVILPGGWDITEKNNSINRDYFHFASHYTASGDTLSLAYSLKYLSDFVPVNKLAEFKDDIRQLSDDGLSYSFTYNPTAGTEPQSPPSDVNGVMVIYALLIVIGLVFIGIYVYQRETPAIVFSYGATFTPIGGWLILVSIVLILTTLFSFLVLIGSDYFSLKTWNLASPGKQEVGYRLFLLMEVCCFLVVFIYSIYCLILLFNKRDILPKAVIGYFAFTTSFVFFDFLFTLVLKHNKMVQPHPYVLIYSILVAAIGIPYFLRSERVEHTFIVPYPSYNYSYEGPEVKHKETGINS